MKAQKIIIKIKHDGEPSSKVNVLVEGDPKIDVSNFNPVQGDNMYVHEALMKVFNSLSIPLERQERRYKNQTAILEIYHSGILGSEVEFNFITSPKIDPFGVDPNANLYIIVMLKRMMDIVEEYEVMQLKIKQRKKDNANNSI